MSETPYERGLKEGALGARLDGQDARLDKINGSIDRFVASNLHLTNEIQKMQEEARARELRDQVAKSTLAAETIRLADVAERERIARAQALEIPVRTWSLRADKATVISVVAATGFAASTIYFSLHL